MGSGLIALQKPPGRQRADLKQNWFCRVLDRERLGWARLGLERLAAPDLPPSLRRQARRAPALTGGSDRRRFARRRSAKTRSKDAQQGRALANESNQVERAISTGKLHALLRFHTRPIDVVVFHGSSGRTCFEAGFPLRCLQRLSIPYIATLHCGWRHNRSTRDTFTPVLSY